MSAASPTKRSFEKSYWEIVFQQFQKNRRAVWGAKVIAILILVAIFAPLIANDKPLAFRGYRYKLYVQTYDQLVYAHGDVAGIGRQGKPLIIPGLYPEGYLQEGLPHDYRREQALWEAKNPSWKLIRNTAFGKAEEPMNRLRAALEEEVKSLRKDAAWARGMRDVAWLLEQKLPPDVERNLNELVALCHQNVPEAYRAKTKLRRAAVLQQLQLMSGEVSRVDRKAIKEFRKRYQKLVGDDIYQSDPDTLGAVDDLLMEMRKRLHPGAITFDSATDFPALRQLTGLDVFFMLSVILWVTRRVWRVPFPWSLLPTGERMRRELRVSLLLPLLLGVAWSAFVPSFNDTTDYERGLKDGSLTCEWRVMPLLRYGVNQNDTGAKYRAPWWAFWSANLAEAEQNTVEAGTGTPPEDLSLRMLAGVKRDVQELRQVESDEGLWPGFLDFLTRHHMGTDNTGRDLLTRMVWGSRISLSIGFVAVGIYVAIGVFLGALAGFFGGWIDVIISRVIEIVLCFPTFFLILTVIAFLDASAMNIMIVIGITGWTGVARLVRGEFLSLRKQDFVIAGQALGFSNARIIFRHVLPNAMAPVLVAATFGVASAILIESGLSFLGFGVKVPTPTWGSVLAAARESWIYWWITLFPGFAIFLAVTMYNLVGEGVRDAVDPKLRQ